MLDAITLTVYFIVAFVVWLWQRERSSFVRQIDRIPGPPKVLLFGNVFPRDGSGKSFTRRFLCCLLHLFSLVCAIVTIKIYAIFPLVV